MNPGNRIMGGLRCREHVIDLDKLDLAQVTTGPSEGNEVYHA